MNIKLTGISETENGIQATVTLSDKETEIAAFPVTIGKVDKNALSKLLSDIGLPALDIETIFKNGCYFDLVLEF